MAVDGTPTPTYPQYTNEALGKGLFDQLMVTWKKHVLTERDDQRINDASFIQHYLGGGEWVMGNVTQYLIALLLIEEKRDNLLAQTDKVREEIELIKAQIAKTNKEIEFIDAKILTEKANTDETIADAGSLIGRQVDLLRIQGLGFAGDLEAKAAKLHSDYDAVYQSVQEAVDASTLSSNAIGNITAILETVEKMKDSSYTDPVFTPPVVWVPPV